MRTWGEKEYTLALIIIYRTEITPTEQISNFLNKKYIINDNFSLQKPCIKKVKN